MCFQPEILCYLKQLYALRETCALSGQLSQLTWRGRVVEANNPEVSSLWHKIDTTAGT